MGNKTNIVKPNGNSDDVIRAALRKDNLNHEAEIQMLMAICEKHDIIIKRDEKTCEISIEFSKEAPRSFAEQASTPAHAPSSSPTNIHLDPRKIGDILAPIIKTQIDASIKEKDISATAYVDSSILVRNNKDVFDQITQEWRDWAEQQHNAVPLSSKGKSPVIAFGGDVCYKVDEDGKLPVDPNRNVGTTEKGKSSKFMIFFSHVWDDMVTSWWKCAAYIIAMCSIVFALASWYKTYRLEQVAKEYYIIKPLLRDDRKFGSFIHALDSAIISSGVDEVCEKIYGRPQPKE